MEELITKTCPIRVRSTKNMKILDQCQDLYYEPLRPEDKKCIKQFLSDPTVDNWNNIRNIIISPYLGPDGEVMTIQRAVFDPFLNEKTGNKSNQGIPTPFQVLHAIKLVVSC